MDNLVVFEMLDAHGELDNQANNLTLVCQGEGDVIERGMTYILHHNEEVVTFSEGSVTPDYVGMINALR